MFHLFTLNGDNYPKLNNALFITLSLNFACGEPIE